MICDRSSIKFFSSDIHFPVHGRDLWLYFHGSMGSNWIQHPSRVVMAEDANFGFVLLFYVFSNLEVLKGPFM